MVRVTQTNQPPANPERFSLDWPPRVGQGSVCCFEWLLGALILKLDRTDIAQCFELHRTNGLER